MTEITEEMVEAAKVAFRRKAPRYWLEVRDADAILDKRVRAALTAAFASRPDTRTDTDGGTWSDGGKVYDPPLSELADTIAEGDVVERLRAYRPPSADPSQPREHHPICDEAAALITSLIAERDVDK